MKLRWHLPAENERANKTEASVTGCALNSDEAKQVLQRILDAQYIHALTFPDESSPRRKDFLELLQELIRAGLEVWFTTDGQGLADSYLHDLVEATPFAISVSFCGATPEIHDSIRGKQSYAAALKALRIFSDHKQRFHTSTLLQTVFHLTPQNQHEAEDFLELSSRFKVDTCCLLTPSWFSMQGEEEKRDVGAAGDTDYL